MGRGVSAQLHHVNLEGDALSLYMFKDALSLRYGFPIYTNVPWLNFKVNTISWVKSLWKASCDNM